MPAPGPGALDLAGDHSEAVAERGRAVRHLVDLDALMHRLSSFEESRLGGFPDNDDLVEKQREMS